MDVLETYLSPGAIKHLQERARMSRPARTYLVLLRLSAFLLSQAQGIEDDSPAQIDQAVVATAQSISTMLPDGYEGIHATLIHITCDMALDYLQQRTRMTRAGKTALLLRLRGKKER